MVRCPGQDQRFWKPGDIFEVICSACGKRVEFFKDEPKLKCPKCGQIVPNPKIDLGCTEWCQYAKQCMEIMEKNAKKTIMLLLRNQNKRERNGYVLLSM